MNVQEAIAVRVYAEGAYPQLKDKDAAGKVWVDLLTPFEYRGIMKVLKDYIMTGNKYPPTVAELIGAYKVVLSEIDETIVQMMLDAGDFDDPDWANPEVAMWNQKKRIESSREMIRRNIMPDWFRARYDHFKRLAVGDLFGLPNHNQQQIGGTV